MTGGTFVFLSDITTAGFEQVEILLVPHGGWHNDTIVTVEKKIDDDDIAYMFT